MPPDVRRGSAAP